MDSRGDLFTSILQGCFPYTQQSLRDCPSALVGGGNTKQSMTKRQQYDKDFCYCFNISVIQQ